MYLASTKDVLFHRFGLCRAVAGHFPFLGDLLPHWHFKGRARYGARDQKGGRCRRSGGGASQNQIRLFHEHRLHRRRGHENFHGKNVSGEEKEEVGRISNF